MVCCQILLLTKLLIMRRFILLIAVLSLCSFSYGQTPTADFAIDRLCRTQDVIFTDNTNYGGNTSDLSYRIYWGDGNISNLSSFPVFHSYANTGNFTISYVVRSSNGNSDSITRNVTVSQPPSVQYTIQNRCFDSAVTLTDNTTIPSGATLVERRWFFPHDGSTYNTAVINKTFSQPGIYQVALKIRLSNGCEDSSVRFVNNYSAPTIDFIADNTCGDSALMVIDNSVNTTGGGISSYTWDFGNGDVRTFTDKRDTQFVGYATPGTYNVTVTMRSPFGCVAQQTKQVTIYNLPTANFTSTEACAKTPTQFTNTSLNPTGTTGAYYFWDFGDASSTTDTSTAMNPTYSYPASGTYTTKLVYGTNVGCRDSITKTVTVLPIPAPNFSLADEFCEDEQVSIFNLTPGSISNYLYDFGDTTTSTDENPTHTYVNTGVFPVSLTVQGSNGCFETYTDTITINPKATPSFTTSGECQGEPVTFTSTSTVSSGAITNYVWQFGDGRISTGQTAQNTYTNAGVFNVRLRLTTDKNCIIEYTQPFTVKPTPVANFSNTAACLGETTQFTNTTSFALGADSITNFFWDFGDGANSNNEDPTHTYANEGTYDVTLRVIGTNGCENSITRQIKVETIPNAGFTATNACVGVPITITNTSVNSVAVTTQYDLANGDTRNGADIQYTYNTPGTYNIIQSVSTAAGCTKTDTQVVEIYPLPTVDFSFIEGCAGIETPFTDLSDTTVIEWLWEFGDGNTSTNQNPVNVYQQGGTFNVRLTTKSVNGCENTASKTINILRKPTALYNIPIPICEGIGVFFQNNSSLNGTTLDQYIWSMGTGDTIVGLNPNGYIYDTSGNLELTLIARNTLGCDDTFRSTITVYAKPVPDFTYEGQCVDVPVQFRNESFTLDNNQIARVVWNIEDIGALATNDPLVTFTTTGYKTITLEAFTLTGNCSNILTDSIFIYPNPIADFTFNDACIGFPIEFRDASTQEFGNIVAWDWSLGDGTKSNEQNPIHTYQANDQYTVIMTAISDLGCENTTFQIVSPRNKPEAEFEQFPDSPNILNPVVEFTQVGSSDVVNRFWDFGDGFIDNSNTVNLEHTYSDTGDYNVTLITYNSDGCTDTFRKVVRIDQTFTIFAPNVVTNDGDGINDFFLPKGDAIERYELVILNRWGQEVFSTTDPNEPWRCDFQRNGKRVQEGVYFYFIKLTDFEGEEIRKINGSVNVIR